MSGHDVRSRTIFDDASYLFVGFIYIHISSITWHYDSITDFYVYTYYEYEKITGQNNL